MTGVHRDTIMRLIDKVGDSCDRYTDEIMRELAWQRLQLDEICAYVGMKTAMQRRLGLNAHPEIGDVYTFVAIDADTSRRS
jgi:hypothetical protein